MLISGGGGYLSTIFTELRPSRNLWALAHTFCTVSRDWGSRVAQPLDHDAGERHHSSEVQDLTSFKTHRAHIANQSPTHPTLLSGHSSAAVTAAVTTVDRRGALRPLRLGT